MLVGWGGNNGTTLTAGILANQLKLEWFTKEGKHISDYFGSLIQSSTVRLGLDSQGKSIYIPFKNILPMIEPNDLIISGWDISGMNIASAMERAQVLDYNLQQQLYPHLKSMQPLPSIYSPNFIASNQCSRADNIINGDKQTQLEKIRQDIRHFKSFNNLDKVIILWTATTERFSRIEPGLNTTADELLLSIQVYLFIPIFFCEIQIH
jgi:myo-inositol-1-phosphate synthase